MKTKYFCHKCGEQLMGDGGWCHCCRENKGDADVKERYFPDDPANKVYAVDVYVTVCKCIKVEAANEDEADRKAGDYVASLGRYCNDTEFIGTLASEGFHDAEEMETTVVGEAAENGNINYH